MIDFKPVELEDKDIINSYLKTEQNMGCEMAFGSLYIWRKAYSTRYAIIEDCLVLWTKDGDNPAGLRFPVGNGDRLRAAELACDYMESIGERPQFYGVTRDVADFIEDNTSNFEVQDMSKYSDYVYETESLITLAGKKLHAKKNHLNKFKKTYKYEYLPIKSSDHDAIMSAYDGWAELDNKYLKAEYDSISDVVKNLDTLDIKGAMLKVDGKIVAFTLGEKLNDKTAVIHVEKADVNYVGSYAAINQMFAENEWSEYKYINREDDCGLEGLKKAKLSYRPAFMVEKFKVIRR